MNIFNNKWIKRIVVFSLLILCFASPVAGTTYLETNIQKWVGLSTDTKPSTSVNIGSRFYESDTNALWLYTPAGWVNDSGFTTKTVTIANGESLSGEVDLAGFKLAIIQMPAAWTAANLTFQVATATGGTFQNLYDDGGTEVSVTAAVSRAISLDNNVVNLAAARFIKIRSGTSGTPVAQGAARTITLILKR